MVYNPASATESALPVRLAYELTVGGRLSGVRLFPKMTSESPLLTDGEVKSLQPRLHPLDQAIVRELRSGVFGQLGDSRLARLLPLLVQRHTVLGGRRLRIEEEPLFPRIRIETNEVGIVRLVLGFCERDGRWVSLEDGRLLAGSQAFFLQGSLALPVESPTPWELASWVENPVINLASTITPGQRDALVRDLARAGVPDESLLPLAVRRGPPERFIVRFMAPTESKSVTASVVLEADYAGERVVVGGTRALSPYVVPSVDANAGLIERDLAGEEDARKVLRRAGFRFDKEAQLFVAKSETAIRSLDPRSSAFPAQWVIDRTEHAPMFRRDLAVGATIQLVEEKGLVDVEVGIQTVDDDDAAVAALVELRDLLAWLQTGNEYVRLPDGSYVAPSEKFKRSLRVISDLGAEAGRALVSPLCVGLLRSLGDSAALESADRATQDWLEELSGLSAPKRIDPPQTLQTIMREYQCRGLDWLAMLHRHRLTGILADDMGLGKTLQTLALLLWVRQSEGDKPSLVVAPTSVVTVWRDEAAHFTPSLKVALWHGPPAVRHTIDVAAHDLVVTSYGILRRDAEILATHPFRYAILDEAQSAKNAATQNAKAIRRLTSERRLALTGTPIENRSEELWAAFDFLAPGFLGNMRQFRKRYGRPINRGDDSALDLLRARVQPLVLRRLKSEVAQELPPKIEHLVRCEMQPSQRALYEHIAGELRDSVLKKIEKVGIERAHLDLLAALTRLRQICADPSLLPAPAGTKVPGSAKLELFEELMREALAGEHRVVVFSQFVQMQKRLIKVIQTLGVDPLWLHGGTRNRDKVVAAFQDPKGPPVIVVSLKAGGTGLTLTRADTVLHYDPWWNPAVERQATDRTHRLGQTQQVTVYKLVCSRSIEERVVQLAEQKDALAEALLSSEGGSGAKRITSQEVLALLQG